MYAHNQDYLVDAIDLEKSFKPSQQLKSYIKYAKTQESELLKNKRMLCLNLVGCEVFIILTCIIFTEYKSLLYPYTVLTLLPYCSYVRWEPPPWWPKHHAKNFLLEYHQARLPLPPTQAIGIFVVRPGA
jgi:hypothetical protein